MNTVASQQVRVMGIDPGVARCGYGIIEKRGDTVTCLRYGVVETPAGVLLSKRLADIYCEFNVLLQEFSPARVGIEELFFCKNAKTALMVGHARGVVLLAAEQMRIPVSHFTPLQVKQAVTTYGKADKRQVQEMVKLLLHLDHIPTPDDASDALAIALCCLHSSMMPIGA